MVLVNLNGLGVNTDAASVMGRLVGNADSIRNYYLDDSYGMQDISAQVFGPINYTMTTCANSDASTLSSSLRPMINGTFQHYLWYIGSRNAARLQLGRPRFGRQPAQPARDTWYNGSTSCVVLVQEPGHNFGMQHSSTLACGAPPFARRSERLHVQRVWRPLRSDGRRLPPHERLAEAVSGLVRRLQRRAASPQRDVHAAAVRAAVQRRPVPADQDAEDAAVQAPGGRRWRREHRHLDYYYLELRTPLDFDGTLGNGTSTLSPRVLVHVGANPRTRTQTGMHTYLLDMTPATTGSSGLNDAGLAMGQTFNDPGGGLSFTTTALSATSATITVTFADDPGAAPTCLDNTTLTGPGPIDCGGAGGRGGAGGTGGSGGSGGGGGSAGSGGGAAGRGGAGGAADHPAPAAATPAPAAAVAQAAAPARAAAARATAAAAGRAAAPAPAAARVARRAAAAPAVMTPEAAVATRAQAWPAAAVARAA